MSLLATVPPIALATLERHATGYLWIVPVCPHCHQRHTHGGGPLAGNPRDLLGHRVGHCIGMESSGYELVETCEGRRVRDAGRRGQRKDLHP